MILSVVCGAALSGGCARPASFERANGAISNASSERDYRREVDIIGKITAVGSSPSGAIAIGTLSGGLYTTRRLDGDWNEIVDSTKPRGFRKYPSNRPLSGEPHGVAFADEQHGMVWGVLNDQWEAETAFVYTTSDGGAQWTRRKVGRGYVLSHAELRSNGEYWVAGYDMYPPARHLNTVVYRSRDFGDTWSAVSTIDGFGAVKGFEMDADGTGVLATIFNRLFVTNDFGKTWQRVATPADQFLPDTARISAGLMQAHRLRGWLVVEQNHQLYRSRVDSIAWQTMDTQQWNFLTVDRGGNRWCFLDAQSRLREADSAWRVSEPLTDPPLARLLHVECKNGNFTGVDVKGRV